MPRKLFLSPLGISNYRACNYNYAEKKIDDVTYIQTAVATLFCADADLLLFPVTREAEEKHREGLTSELEKHRIMTPLQFIHIPDGGSEQQLWDIFKILSDAIEDGDRVTFDITHSFRSLPMIFLILLQYLKVTKNISIEGVYYGAFEKGTQDCDTPTAPIFDLTPFIALHDWTNAIQDFSKFGNASELSELISKNIRPILKETKGQDKTAKAFRSLKENIIAFTSAVQTNRLEMIIEGKLQKNIQQACADAASDSLPQMQPVLGQLTSLFNDYQESDIDNGLRAVDWCLKHGMTQQGFTLLQETIISWIVALIEVDRFDSAKDARTFASELLQHGGKTPASWKKLLGKHTEYALSLLQCLSEDLMKAYDKLAQARNDINHAGTGDNARTSERLQRELQSCYSTIKSFLTIPSRN